MKGFNDYLEQENLFQKLIEYYKVDRRELELHYKTFIKENAIPEGKFKAMDLNYEFLGARYENVLNYDDRKSLGQYYTPKTVVQYILNAVGYKYIEDIEDKKLIDLSCGIGNFIIPAIKILISRYLLIFKRRNIHELLPSEAKLIVEGIKKTIHGIDINPIACILCQINIHYAVFEIFKLIIKKGENYHLPIFNVKSLDAMTIEKTIHFDIVVGNPPYLFIRDIPRIHRQNIKNMKFKTSKGQFDYFHIFIELGIRVLRNKGLLGYIIPDSLLALSSASKLRMYIYNTTKIKEIFHIGPQFEDPVVSNIVLILEKEQWSKKRESNLIKIRLSNSVEKEILQENLRDWGYMFLIHLSKEDASIIQYLNHNFTKLGDLINNNSYEITLSRGVELAKTGEIIYCEFCSKYFPVPKGGLKCPDCKRSLKIENLENIIVENPPKENINNYKLFLYKLNRYQVREYKYIDVSKKGINYKNPKIYEDRIVIRQLNQNNLICATYDANLSFTSQSLYNLKIHKSPIREFNNFFLLGILNSLLISYFFIKSFGSYKKLFPRILIEKVQDLPI
ncbi:MAG: Eco57I restriction-modification methylase domain-containing protein, partial [Candidatus Thorarchaeota archaeon]